MPCAWDLKVIVLTLWALGFSQALVASGLTADLALLIQYHLLEAFPFLLPIYCLSPYNKLFSKLVLK